MISILITSFKEPKTIGRAITSLTNQNIKNYELLVSAPDKETIDVAKSFAKKNKRIKVFQDKGKGKPAALNLLFKKVKGKIIVLTDGDVLVHEGALNHLLQNFNDKQVGSVSGRVISANSLDSMFGYWAHLLTTGFHTYRKREKDKVICSGYLYAIRTGIVKDIPEDILADDAYISLKIMQKGFKSIYCPEALVSVKYPTNLPDWISQKKRTASRAYQLAKYFNVSKPSSFKEEIIAGFKVLREIKEFIHLPWFAFLIVMRLYIWFRILFDFRLWKRSFSKTWERVESTKS